MALPDWLKPGRGLPAAVRTSLITIAAVLALGYFLQFAGLYEAEDKLTATLEAGSLQDGIVPLTVTLRLNNHDEEGVLYEAENPCNVFRWILLDPERAFVQSEAEENCPDVHMEQYIKPKHYLEQSYTLEIDARRLKTGESYVLQMRFWGEEIRKDVPPLLP
ncbi:conserved protein [Tepidicaulis marinus]|uniref:Conserved protein n=1 Tax=Tepidicaulis marinus TaxID=1333998 RepID=A0A081B7X7_9HYPH|nr:hypothetical protein [Tepidicaulis marinus]GAK44145.1 conserved protein [Tepidicaulis marinus]